ncbi:MAG: ligase-associated DNA damage response DEXH box helicase [Flavobacteriales bacterium]
MSKKAEAWMKKRGWTPQRFQCDAWNALGAQRQGIVNALTGSGKTYSILLPYLFDLHQSKSKSPLQCIWITPIKALAKEIQSAAQRVIDECQLPIRVGIRTGDTEGKERQRQQKAWPNILITTPESLHLIFCKKKNTDIWSALQLLVVDEWHELMGSKRGVQMELALAHLRHLRPQVLVWGISATIGNLHEALHVLLGPAHAAKGELIQSSIIKRTEVIPIQPDKPERMPWAGHLGIHLLPKLLPILRESQSTLIFTNVRSQCEIWYRSLMEAAPDLAGTTAIHHGSISKEIRDWVESSLHAGKLHCVICTSSLDLGVDFAPVETIVQIGGPKGIARFMQRAGRSGHSPDGKSRIYFLPTHSLELIECAALQLGLQQGELEKREPYIQCFDVLIQWLVTLGCGDGFRPEDVLESIRATHCYQHIQDDEFLWCLNFAAAKGTSLHEYPEYHKIQPIDGLWLVNNQRIARRHRMSIGTIVSDTLVAVRMRGAGLLGHIEESFIAQLHEGDAFWFAGMSVELMELKELTAKVKKSKRTDGRSPVWLGGSLPLTSKMSHLIRQKIEEASESAPTPSQDPIIQFIRPIFNLQAERSHIPNTREMLIEQFESEDGYHTMFYPFEGKFVHEGLAALIAHRIGEQKPMSFSIATNDYGFELLSNKVIEVHADLVRHWFRVDHLERDLLAGVNGAELAGRQFRDIATIAGLLFKGYPGQPIRDRHLQSSAQLLFRVFQDYDVDNLLIRQSYNELVYRQFDILRMRDALDRILSAEIIITRPDRPTPFAFPILVDRLRERMSSESLKERIAQMTIAWTS